MEWRGSVLGRPWAWGFEWGRASHATAIENARVAAVECSRARVERAEVELYVAELLAARERLDRPSLLA
jgi:hypothetical protein